MKVALNFGALVRPVRQGQPLTDQTEIAQLQQAGKLPFDKDNMAHISHPMLGFYIVTPPEANSLPSGAALFSFLKTQALDVEV